LNYKKKYVIIYKPVVWVQHKLEEKPLKKVVVLLAFLALAVTVSATPIHGTDAPFTGSTTLLGFGNWDNPDPELSWEITSLPGGLFLYVYEFTHGGSDLSHLVLEFSPNCAGDLACITNGTNNPDGPRTYAANTAPNFEMPAAIFGVKFSEFGAGSPNTFSFTSNRAPVWGNVYLRDGGNAYAYNAGLTNMSSSLMSDFVARPDGFGNDTQVPEPASFALLGGGLLVLGMIRRRRLS
jgi:hypothetical protein